MTIRANVSIIFQSEEHPHEFKEPTRHIIISDFKVFKKHVTEFVLDELEDGMAIISGFVNNVPFYIATSSGDIDFSPIENAIKELDYEPPVTPKYLAPRYFLQYESFLNLLEVSNLAKYKGKLGYIKQGQDGKLGFRSLYGQKVFEFDKLTPTPLHPQGGFAYRNGKLETSMGKIELLKLVNVLE